MLSSSAFWQTQHLLHGKNSNALPTALLVVAGTLVLYRHMTEEVEGKDVLKTFLALIMVQMLPLVLIEVKITSCPDPMALLSRFGSKVLLMHACFLALRVYRSMDTLSVLGLAGSFVALFVGFGLRPTLLNVYEHRDVWALVALGALTAVVEESISVAWSGRRGNFMSDVLVDMSNYVEILAFMPAVWMMYRHKSAMSAYEDDAVRRWKANWFFAFLMGFYFMEDITSLGSLWSVLPLACIGHVAHFLLVLDFSGFMLAHIYSPEKIKEGLARLSNFGAGCFV